jgi:hypothetical protein
MYSFMLYTVCLTLIVIFFPVPVTIVQKSLCLYKIQAFILGALTFSEALAYSY